MPKVLVLYDSKTGNTRRMAYAVAEGARSIKQVSVDLKRVDRANLADLRGAHGIIIGSPTYYGQMSAKTKALIDKSVRIHGSLEGKVGAAFTSSGATASGAETTLLSIIESMLIHGMILQGRSERQHYGVAAVGPPKKGDLRLCKKLGQRVSKLVVTLYDSNRPASTKRSGTAPS